MTEQERQLIESVAARLRSSPVPEIDAEADELIGRTIGQQPNALYILTQTVLLQELALRRAKAGAAPPPGFPGGAAAAGRWGRDGGLQQEPLASGYRGSTYHSGAAAATGGVPPQPPPDAAAPPTAWVESRPPQSRMSGFLEGAAQTAAGVIAGEMAFSALSSLFGHHGGGFSGGGGYGGGGGFSETTINNNYYGGEGSNQQHHEPGHETEPRAAWSDDLIADDTSYDEGTDSFDV